MKSLTTRLVRRFASTAAQGEKLEKTPLYDYHINKLNAKMTNFHGHVMPIQYSEGLVKEHFSCRENAAVFDVSHMAQLKIYGRDREKFIEKLVVGDYLNCPVNTGFLSLILNNEAGIVDDAIVTKFEDHINMVVNAGNKYGDLEHMFRVRDEFFPNSDLKIEHLQDKALVALQGPKSAQVLQALVDQDLSKYVFMNHFFAKCPQLGTDLQICRSGYTGEDGFEISISDKKVEAFCDLLFANSFVKPAGLGARDTLRLEAGLCLHGNDIDATINPAEATLMWTVRKDPRDKFIGYEALENSRKKLSKKRVGFVVQESGVLRHGMDVEDAEGNKIGTVTSGSHAPSLGKSVGMCYVPPKFAKVGTDLFGVVRGRKLKIKIEKMPFVPHRYFRGQEN